MILTTPKIPARSALIALVLVATIPLIGLGQAGDTTTASVNGLSKLSARDIRQLDRKYEAMGKALERSSNFALQQLQQSEIRMQHRISSPDSSSARRILQDGTAQYQRLQNRLAAGGSAVASSASTYIGRIDSLQTALRFLNGSAVSGLPTAKLQELEGLSQQLEQVQAKWTQAAAVQQFVQQREQFLQQQLSRYNVNNLLGSVNQKAWYYQQQLAQYKSELNDPEKIGERILGVVRRLPAFQTFWQKNSLLAQLFPLPAGYGTPLALNGLQSRAHLQTLFHGANGISANPDYSNQQAEQAESTLDKLKEKVRSVGGTSGSGDMTLPNFTPDGQHGKSLFHRLEYGFTIQNTNRTPWIPATSNFTLTLGYKISDKATVGVGGGFLLGLGNGIQSIHFSSQGASLQAYTNLRLKGGWWAAGSFERTYYQAYDHLVNAPPVSSWQPGLLTGLMRKWPVGKRSANMQLLYNWLYAQQLPHGQALQFWIGYTF